MDPPADGLAPADGVCPTGGAGLSDGLPVADSARSRDGVPVDDSVRPVDDSVRLDDGDSVVVESGVNAGARRAWVVPLVRGGSAASDAGVRVVAGAGVATSLLVVPVPSADSLLPVDVLPVDVLVLDDEDPLDAEGLPDDVSPAVDAGSPARRRVGGVKLGGSTFEARVDGRAAPTPPPS